MKERFLNRIGVNKEKKGKLCLLIPIMKSSIKSNRGISLSRDAPFSWLCSVCSTSVSMHALRAGCDIAEVLFNTRFLQFQSTHPGRGATKAARVGGAAVGCFNPRTPGGVRPISSKIYCIEPEFQSRPPGRGATIIRHTYNIKSTCFNPRTPGGVRHAGVEEIIAIELFQSTHPGRGAT